MHKKERYDILFLVKNMRLRNVKNKQEILDSSKLLIIDYESKKGKWNKEFNNNNPIFIEIGMGKGDFILNNALTYPDINFIGIEKFYMMMEVYYFNLIIKNKIFK